VGPKLLWRFKNTGVGFSGPAIVGDRLYIMGARKEKAAKQELEYLIAIDVTTGKELWAVPIGPTFTWAANSYGDGPRGTPTVDGEYIYALGGQGELVCVSTSDKKIVWRKNLTKDFQGKYMNQWGYCESPLVDGDQLVCSPGGPKGTILALDKKTGAVKWRCTQLTDDATFGSMVAADFGGIRQYVQTTYNASGGQIVGVAAKNGDLLWTYPQKFDSTDVCATPIIQKDFVYLTAGRKSGCTLLQIQKKKGKVSATLATPYKKTPIRRAMDNEYGGVVLVGDSIYGFTDSRGGSWICQELASGKQVWTSKKKVGKGSVTSAGGQLYLYTEDEGQVALVEASPKIWKENGRFEIPEKSNVPMTRKSNSGAKIWTPPVVSNGRLYLRDQELLFCYDVAKEKGK
jgi:outer membrane protein assembly factor BamB